MLLSVIIVSYNTQDLTIAAIKAVHEQILTSKLLTKESELIVVDNFSTDGSIEALKALAKTLPMMQLQLNTKNHGFAKANNQAIKVAKGQFILLLNSDTKVQKDCLENLTKTLIKHPSQEQTAFLSSTRYKFDNLGIVAAKLLNPDLTPQPQGGAFPSLFTTASQMFFLDDIPLIGRFFPSAQHTGRNQLAQLDLNQAQPTLIAKDWVGGTAMMVKREVFDQVGPLDENIFMYTEDTEFCLRAKKHQFDIAIANNAQVIHYANASSSNANAIIGEIKGLIYLFAKHQSSWQMPILKTILILGCYLRIILFNFSKKNQQKVAIYQQALSKI